MTERTKEAIFWWALAVVVIGGFLAATIASARSGPPEYPVVSHDEACDIAGGNYLATVVDSKSDTVVEVSCE